MPPTMTRKADVAHSMLKALATRAVNIIKGGGWRGGDLVKIDSEITRPCFRDFMSNKTFIFFKGEFGLYVFKSESIHL